MVSPTPKSYRMLNAFRRTLQIGRFIERAIKEGDVWEAAGDDARHQVWSADQFFQLPSDQLRSQSQKPGQVRWRTCGGS